MVKPNLRSRSHRRIHIVLPSGKSAIHYEKRKSKNAKCTICGNELHGTAQGNKISKSEKRPQRIFGGFLCHECLENLIKQTVRGMS